MPDCVVHEEEVYDDEDDENEEGNWRNDYPDEDSDADSDREERYGGRYLRIIVSHKSLKSIYFGHLAGISFHVKYFSV